MRCPGLKVLHCVRPVVPARDRFTLLLGSLLRPRLVSVLASQTACGYTPLKVCRRPFCVFVNSRSEVSTPQPLHHYSTIGLAKTRRLYWLRIVSTAFVRCHDRSQTTEMIIYIVPWRPNIHLLRAVACSSPWLSPG